MTRPPTSHPSGRRLPSPLALPLLPLLLAACGGGSDGPPPGPVGPAPVAVVAVTAPGNATLEVGATLTLVVKLSSAQGATLDGRAVAWASDAEGVATVSANGVVTGVAPGQATLTAAAEGKTGRVTVTVVLPPVSQVLLSPSVLALAVGESAAVEARLLDAAGRALTGRAVAWRSADAAVAAVAPDGRVVAVGAGRTTVIAAAEGREAWVPVVVTAGPRPPWDFAVVDAVWTQGVQTAEGSFPMLLDRPAVVNVVLSATGSEVTPGQLVLVLEDGNGEEVRADTIVARAPEAGASLEAPSAQFLVPAPALRPGLRWRVVRDPRLAQPDADIANDAYPRAGPARLLTMDVPTLRLRFVPVLLEAHAQSTGNVTAANVEEYLGTVRGAFPVGRVDVQVTDPFATDVAFGTAPVGGGADFFIPVLQELDLARVAAGEGEAYWYGVVRPPSGFFQVQYGGFGYVPRDPFDDGTATRTAIGIGAGWSREPSAARETFAHELGHNMGRMHSPCGGATDSDPQFPVYGGLIGAAGHDVHSWASGRTGFAPTVPATHGDVMGYCFPRWTSHHTYGELLDARGSASALVASVLPERRERVLVVRGRVDGGAITLRPAVAITGVATREAAGPYRVEGVDADGTVLFARRVAPTPLDHEATALFTVAVPMDAATEGRLAELRVIGPAGTARLRARAASTAGDAAGTRTRVRRLADGRVEAACADAGAAAVVVSDPATGAVLAAAGRATVRLPARAGVTLQVACSDGLRTTATMVRE